MTTMKCSTLLTQQSLNSVNFASNTLMANNSGQQPPLCWSSESEEDVERSSSSLSRGGGV